MNTVKPILTPLSIANLPSASSSTESFVTAQSATTSTSSSSKSSVDSSEGAKFAPIVLGKALFANPASMPRPATPASAKSAKLAALDVDAVLASSKAIRSGQGAGSVSSAVIDAAIADSSALRAGKFVGPSLASRIGSQLNRLGKSFWLGLGNVVGALVASGKTLVNSANKAFVAPVVSLYNALPVSQAKANKNAFAQLPSEDASFVLDAKRQANKALFAELPGV